MLERREKGILSESSSNLGQGQRQQVPVEGQSQQTQRQRHNYPMAQMDRLFDEIFKRPFFSLWSHRMGEHETAEQLFVPVDIFEDGESVIVKAELPGMKKEDINVQLTPDSITISGEKRSESKVQEENFFRMESSCGSFTRTCQLPAEVLSDKARAVFRDGVLEIRIPKSMETRQRGRNLTIE